MAVFDRNNHEALAASQASPELFQIENLVSINRILSAHGFRLGPTHELHLHHDICARPENDLPPGFDFRICRGNEVTELYRLPGFANALQYGGNALRPDILAAVAYQGDRAAGIAAASRDCPDLWQIGVDVVPDCRGKGLGIALTRTLAAEIHTAGALPCYGTWNGNLASRNLALKAGFFPCWIENYAIPE